MTYRCFDVDITDRVAHVRLNRPDELNTMTPDFWRELPEIVTGISDDATARVVVISSTGRHFSAGMDLSVFGGDGLQADAEPVRYASADAFFCVQEINIGMTADVGTLQRIGKVIPEGVARELAYTGRRMQAARAYEVGLVQEVFADADSLVEGVLAIAREIAEKSPLAIWGTKVAMNYARDHSVDDSLEQIATWQSGMFQPADMVESFTAKAEKRPPAFPELLPEPTSL
ncbi:MAG: enoyl-CoA hydratase/isomerase family protein [Actinobacteria bacterium]|nr:enoyl-CoA hydratase/isomerase family protein [Actinomycetota bacterium]